MLVPAAVSMLEPAAKRLPFTRLGVAVSVVLMYAVARGPIDVRSQGSQIGYSVDLWQGGLVVALYVLATCGPLLASQHRHVRWFGAANLVIVAALAWLNASGFISLWCFWAAITSAAIAIHLRYSARPPVALVRA